jgi:prolyl-tRNA synthetase
LFEKNKSFRETNTYKVDSYQDFKEKIEKWFVMAHWDWTKETAEKIQQETKATIRCIPFDSSDEDWVDIITGKPSKKRVLFAKSY